MNKSYYLEQYFVIVCTGNYLDVTVDRQLLTSSWYELYGSQSTQVRSYQ